MFNHGDSNHGDVDVYQRSFSIYTLNPSTIIILDPPAVTKVRQLVSAARCDGLEVMQHMKLLQVIVSNIYIYKYILYIYYVIYSNI